MKQLTLRGFDAELERRLRATARRNGVSLNKAALDLLRRGAGMKPGTPEPDSVGNALDAFIGNWTARDVDELLAAVEPLEAIDEELWR